MTATTNHPQTAKGDQIGIGFPTTIEALLAAGTDFLTRAFHATGAISPGNAVREIVSSREFFGGGMGRKLILSVRYAIPEPGIPSELFIKFPRDFGDPMRDLFTPPMEPEARFALLSRREGFPVAVPQCMFADYDASVPAGILITECITYGQGSVEPAHDKCMDDELLEPLAHYEALTRTMARLAAYHKTGGFGDETDRQFPHDPHDTSGSIPYTPEQLQEKLDILQIFAREVPHLFPDGTGDPEFLRQFAQDVPAVLVKEQAIKQFLNTQTDQIALCHWNMNVDNAWFWREPDGELKAGLLDWGSVSQTNIALAFFGMTCAAEPEFMDQHRDHLIRLLVNEYERHGAARIDPEQLLVQVRLGMAIQGVAWMLDAPTIIRREVPEILQVSGRHDPRLRGNFLARAQLHLLITFLNEWRSGDIGKTVRDFEEFVTERA